MRGEKEKGGRTAGQIISWRLERVELRSSYTELLLKLAGFLFFLWLLLTQLLLILQAPDNQMFPAIKAGDLVIAYRLEGEYAKNDVVVYEWNGEIKIGRIVAREGDVVTINDSGQLLVNGTVQTGEIVFSTYASEDSSITYPYTVLEGCVFILCDYRTEATDSREYGAVPLTRVSGKVITILRRRDL